MKKNGHILVGILIGIALTLSTAAAADGVNSIFGKQIDGEFTVTLNGQELPVKAGTIEGASYLPVRAVSEALGLEVGFNKETGVSLKSKNNDAKGEVTMKDSPYAKYDALYKTKEELVIAISDLERNKIDLEIHIQNLQDPGIVERTTSQIKEFESEIKHWQNRLAELEKTEQ